MPAYSKTPARVASRVRLDTGSCFFEEAQGGTHTGQTYGPNHRKVVAYRAYADASATGQADHIQ